MGELRNVRGKQEAVALAPAVGLLPLTNGQGWELQSPHQVFHAIFTFKHEHHGYDGPDDIDSELSP